jgi:hypothetical protein
MSFSPITAPLLESKLDEPADRLGMGYLIAACLIDQFDRYI